MAFATIAFSLAGGVVNEITPYLIEAVDFWIFIIFAIVNFGMLVPIFLFYIGELKHFPNDPSGAYLTSARNCQPTSGRP